MEPEDLVGYLEEALGRSYHGGEAILGILLAGMRKDPECLTRRDCAHLLKSVAPFIKDPQDTEKVRDLLKTGRAPMVDAYRATFTQKRVPKGG